GYEGCIPGAQMAFDEGRIGLKQMYAISQQELGQPQDELLDLALKGDGAAKLEHQGRRARNGSTNGDHVRVSSMRCPLPSGVVVTIRGKELSLSDGIEAVSDLLKQMRKGVEDGWDSKTFAKVCKDRAREKGG